MAGGFQTEACLLRAVWRERHEVKIMCKVKEIDAQRVFNIAQYMYLAGQSMLSADGTSAEAVTHSSSRRLGTLKPFSLNCCNYY